MRKHLKVFLGVSMVGGLLFAASSPAMAAPPLALQQFNPNDSQFASGGNCAAPNPGTPQGCINDYLSDKFDGVDSLAHLTAVASADTDNVTWYACPLGTGPAVTQTELGACNVTIGTDSSGRLPSGGTFLAPIDEAYDINWDIPGSLDQQRRDIVAVACIGTGQDVEGGDANCRTDTEENIFLEDAQTGAAQNQTTSGEFGQLRTLQSCLNVAPGNAACDAVREDFPHGSNVPNDGFDFQAFTSDEVNNLQAAVNEPADATSEPSNANFDGFVNCTLEQTLTNFKRWRCSIGDALIADNSELAISLLNANGAGAQPTGTAGYCNSNNNPSVVDYDPNTGGAQAPPPAQNQVPGAHDACVMDRHYVVSIARQATQVVQTFQPGTGLNPQPPANASCANPDKAESNELNEGEKVTICVTDNFGDPITSPVTEEITGPGKFDDCGTLAGGGPHDHDSNGADEHCHGTATSGVGSDIDVSNIDGATPGTVTITSCVDPQNGGPVANPPANHGCADAPANLKDTLTLSYGATPEEVFLAFAGTGTAGDPCRTGATIANGTVGQRETLVVCTFDSNGNPIGTDVDATRLQWTITGAHGNDQPSVRFVGNPPSETTGNGEATLQIDDIGPGDNFVEVRLLDSNGQLDDTFFVEKDVAGGGGGGGQGRQNCPGGFDNIRGTRNSDKIKGDGGCDKIRGLAGNDKLKGRGGDDRLIGGPGNDLLVGGNGFDICSGNKGRDKFRGCERIKKR